MAEVLLGSGDTVPDDITWLFRTVAAAHPEGVQVAALRQEAKDRGVSWDSVSRKAKRSGLLDAHQRSGAASYWVWVLTDEGARQAGKQ
jgi:IS5 family transposase